ncbi:MAG: hypothetical protein ACRYFX_05705 [Janthinobacterium lividum]
MSIESITLDEFAMLTLEEHEEALDLYDEAISKAAEDFTTLEVDYDRFAKDRDKLGRLLTLRKVHQVRHDELLGEQPAPALASEQIFNPELDQLPA